jgi:hypothetical protein
MSRAKGPGVSGDAVETYLDRITLQTRVEARRTIQNDGNQTPNFTTFVEGKFFARGMVGQIESINIYTQNPTAVPRLIDVRFRAYHDEDDDFRALCWVPPNTPTSWVTFIIRKSWNYDRMFVYAASIDSQTGIGYDTAGNPDSFGYDAVNDKWYEISARLFIQVTMSAQVPEAIPVGVQTPIKVEVDKGKYLAVVPSVGFFNGNFDMGDLTGWTGQGVTIVARSTTTNYESLSNSTENGYIDLVYD